MYDDPMREQMRQAHRLARLQALTGQAPVGMPGMPAFPGMDQPAPATPAHQPFDFARTISGGIGGQAGWMAGAHLASKLAASAPHPYLKAAGMAANFGIPVMASLLGATALPTAIDAVSPSIHDSANSAMRKAGPGGALAGAGLGAYLMWRNRKGLPAAGNFSMRTPVTPQSVGVRAFLPHHADVSSPPSAMVGRARTGAPFSGAERVIVPAAPVPAPVVPAPTLQQAAGHVMTDIVKDPLMASQPIPMAASLAQHVLPSFVQTSHVGAPPKLSHPLTINMPVHPSNAVGHHKIDQMSHAMDMMHAGYHPHEAIAMAESLHPAPGIAPIPAVPEGNVYRPGFALKKNSRSPRQKKPHQ